MNENISITKWIKNLLLATSRYFEKLDISLINEKGEIINIVKMRETVNFPHKSSSIKKQVKWWKNILKKFT